MKVLTLHQPWASLIALGVKTIETRSWPTQYRGPLAIHAAARPTEVALLPYSALLQREKARGAPCSKCRHTESIHTCRMVRTECILCGCDGWSYGGPPLGAIVATCTLVDVVPTGELRWWDGPTTPDIASEHEDDPPCWWTLNEGQRPYGDFTPGRYAWLLADVVAVDPPVPFKGGQGLTKTWTPEAVPA